MIKTKDLLLISMLRKNARETLTNLSRMSRIPVSTIFDKLKASKDTLITKYTSLIDFSRLGYNTRAFFILKVGKKQREDIRYFLENHTNVNTIIRVNNGFDFFVEVIFKDVREVEDFMEHMEEKFIIRQKAVYYAICDLKREGFLADPEAVGRYFV